MSLETFRLILDKLPPTVRRLNLWHRGGPLAAPDVPEMVAAASARGIRTHTHTNGTLLRHNDAARRLVKARLTGISVAVDGADEETYQRFRTGGTLADVAAGIQALAEAKRDLHSRYPKITVECLVGNQDPAQFAAIREMAMSWGANNVKFKTLRIEDLNATEEALQELPQDPGLRRYDLVDGTLKMKRTRNSCRRLAYSFLIAWNGDVYPCCFYLKSFAPMGNVFEQPFQEVWRKGMLVELQEIVKAGRDRIPMCRNCTEGLPCLYADPSKEVMSRDITSSDMSRDIT